MDEYLGSWLVQFRCCGFGKLPAGAGVTAGRCWLLVASRLLQAGLGGVAPRLNDAARLPFGENERRHSVWCFVFGVRPLEGNSSCELRVTRCGLRDEGLETIRFKVNPISSLHACPARPLQNAPFCPISSSDSNFNPRNTQCIPVVKIIAFLALEQK